jgi:DNA-binding transcriptional LysR family regulator
MQGGIRIDIRQLQVVSEIIRLGSFTKAAESLHVTQPTISKIIKSTEDELQMELFAREGRAFKLTDAGHAILQHAGPILQAFDNLMQELNDLSYLNKGSIRFGVPPMAGARFFPEVIKQFQEKYPGITLGMLEDGARKIEESVADGTLDAGVVLWPADEAMFNSIPIVKDRLKVIVPANHPFAERQRISLRELAAESFILFNSDFALHGRIINECRQTGFDPRIVHESSQWDFIGGMVGAGLGVAMLPGAVCNLLDEEKTRAIELDDPIIPWEPVLVWRREGYLSRAAREWVQFMTDYFGEKAD